MLLIPIKSYYYGKLKFGDLVTLKDGYIVKAKKNYIGFLVKKGTNLSFANNIILFDKLYKKFIKSTINGKDLTLGLKYILNK